VDQYVNWHNTLLGQAVVEVLRQQDVEVYVPSGQTPSWMTLLSSGDVVRARRLARQNVRILSDAVQSGYEIVTVEPSSALCLKEEYPSLFGSEDAKTIAENTSDICSYLCELHDNTGLKLDFEPVDVSVLYHQPCHSRALDPANPALKLLEMIPGVEIGLADAGCSGMAGTFGLQRKNFVTSIRIGRKLIGKMKETKARLGATECSSCKLQMEQGTNKPTVHPVAVLAYAYGRLPELKEWFTSSNDSLVVR